MPRYQWGVLNKQQVGTYAEYFVKMELTMYGFEVYDSEVDDHGVDFVARRRPGPYVEVQVKSLRKCGYVFLQKSKFALHDHLFLALVLLFENHAPQVYLIPSNAWAAPNRAFVGRDYPGLRSKPEWGLNVSKRNLQFIEPYAIESVIASHFPRSHPQ